MVDNINYLARAAEWLAMARHEDRRCASPLSVSFGWHDLDPEDQATMTADAREWLAALVQPHTHQDALAAHQAEAQRAALDAAYRAGAEAMRERAALRADETQTQEWAGGDEWAAGYVDGKNAAAAAIRALPLPERGA